TDAEFHRFVVRPQPVAALRADKRAAEVWVALFLSGWNVQRVRIGAAEPACVGPRDVEGRVNPARQRGDVPQEPLPVGAGLLRELRPPGVLQEELVALAIVPLPVLPLNQVAAILAQAHLAVLKQ